MVLNADNVRQAITGAFYWDPTGQAPAPTGLTQPLDSGFADLGYISEEGVTLTLPGEGDVTNIRAWQNGAIVRTIRTPSEDQPTFQMTFIETKLEVIEMVFGVTVQQAGDSGTYVINSNVERKHGSAVLDVIDGDNAERYYAPHAVVSSLDAISFTNGDPIGYNVTVTAEFVSSINGQVQVWDASLASTTPPTEPSSFTVGETPIGGSVIA